MKELADLESRLRDVAAGEVDAVLSEATASARRQAVEILAARLTELIVEEAAALPHAGVARRPEAEPAKISATGGWYLYGITWSDVADALTGDAGVCGAPLQTVRIGPVAAVVSPVSDRSPWGIGDGGGVDLEALAPRVAEHQHVLERVLETGPVVPLRFGVLYPELTALVTALEGDAFALAAQLRRLDGLVEWGLTIECDATKPSPLETMPPENGRQYLSRRQQDRAAMEGAASAAAEAVAVVHDALTAFAAAVVVHPSRGPGRGDRRPVLRASYLVPQSKAVAFREAAGGALASAPGDLQLTGDLTGPWPAYNFVDIHLEEAV